MIARAEIDGRSAWVDLSAAIDISIPMSFAGHQPSAFGAPVATAMPYRLGENLLDTAVGGSCNVEVVSVVPVVPVVPGQKHKLAFLQDYHGHVHYLYLCQ